MRENRLNLSKNVESSFIPLFDKFHGSEFTTKSTRTLIKTSDQEKYMFCAV